MPRQKKRVTIEEIAQRAGVSVATASRAFNNSPLVVKETGNRIRKIARELNYVPNASARSLSMKKTETLGLLLPDMHGEFFSEIIRGADAVARKEKYHLLVSSSHNTKDELETAVKVMSGRVDGFIVMSPHLDPATLLTHFLKTTPTVVLNSSIASSLYDSIRIDNKGGAKQVMEHLIGLGHRRIAIIKGDTKSEDAVDRLAGYLAALKEAHIDLVNEYIVEGDFTDRTGYLGAAKLLSLPVRPSAIFASNDEMAIGTMRYLREQNVNIPDDIAVAGFDDIQMSSFIHPSLTTVHVNISELGSLAVRRLIGIITSEQKINRQTSTILPAELVVRETTVKKGAASRAT